MNIIVMLAGGVGKRCGAPIPKQFISVLGKPVIVHTLEQYESFDCVDAIEVVTVKDYIEDVEAYREKYNLKKLKYIVEGGDTCQLSIKNGILNLKDKIKDDDVISIVSSVSPLTEEEIILDSLRVCKEHGGAICAKNCRYNITTLKEGNMGNDIIYKENHVTLNFPWTYPFKKLLWAYEEIEKRNMNVGNNAYTPTLMVDLGENLYFSKESENNQLKVETFDDVDMIEGYLLIEQLRKGNREAADLIRKSKESVD